MKLIRLVFGTAAVLMLFSAAANADCSSHNNENQCNRDPGCAWADEGSFSDNAKCVPVLQDLCIEKVEGEGFELTAGGLTVQGGWLDTVTLRNRGTETLTDVDLTLDTDGLQVNVLNKCGIDVTGTPQTACQEKTNLQVGDLVSLLRKALFFGMPDFGADQTHTFSIYSGVSISVFEQERLYGSYVKNGELFYGRIEQCGAGGGEINTAAADKADIISTFSSVDSYNNGHDKYITTKVAGHTQATITGVHLNPATHEAEAYHPAVGNSDWKFTIIPLLSDGTCGSAQNVIDPDTGKQVLIDIPWGSSYGGFTASVAQTKAMAVPAFARRDNRFQIIVVDPQTLNVKAQQCILSSSQIGNIERLGQCANSENQYREAYGDEAWERCGESHGRPCISQNNGSADTNDATYNAATDAIYTNELGCYMCTFNIAPGCSTDNFAIRPESYDLDLNDTSALLTAGKPYTLNATGTSVGGGSTPAPGYTTTLDNTLDKNASLVFAPAPTATDCPDTSNHLFSIGFTDSVGANTFSYPNVGDINITLSDGNWTAVDQNKAVQECLPGSNRTSPEPVGCLVSASLPKRFIPQRFELNATLENFGNGFTYLYDMNREDDYNGSAAVLTVDVSARNFLNDITTNYTEHCYAKETNITLDAASTAPEPADALSQLLYFNPEEANATADSGEGSDALSGGVITSPLTIINRTGSFPADAPDGYGTTHIEYKLNFDRKVNKPVNPFRLALNHVNIRDAEATPFTVTGTHDTNDAATFLFGRVHAPRYRVSCGDPSAACTSPALTMYFEYYSDFDSNVTLRRSISSDDQRSKDGIVWFRNPSHETTDGNITSVTQRYIATSPISEESVTRNGATEARSYKFTPSTWGYPYKSSMKIDPSKWLIYNRFDENATYNTFALEYSAGAGNKAGTGDLGDGPGSSAATTARRIRW